MACFEDYERELSELKQQAIEAGCPEIIQISGDFVRQYNNQAELATKLLVIKQALDYKLRNKTKP